jgi:hypothetical protein
MKKLQKIIAVMILMVGPWAGWPSIDIEIGEAEFSIPRATQIAAASSEYTIFRETCNSNPARALSISVGTSTGMRWSARVALVGSPATVINSGQSTNTQCGPLADTTNIGFGYFMQPSSTVATYAVVFNWIDGGTVAATSPEGMLVNYLNATNYYACAFNDDATPEVAIYKVSGGTGSTLSSAANQTVNTGDRVKCQISYSGSTPTISVINVTSGATLATATDSSGPLAESRTGGVYCGAIPTVAATDDCESQLLMDEITLVEIHPDSRSLRLFNGFKIKLFNGRLIIHQRGS